MQVANDLGRDGPGDSRFAKLYIAGVIDIRPCRFLVIRREGEVALVDIGGVHIGRVGLAVDIDAGEEIAAVLRKRSAYGCTLFVVPGGVRGETGAGAVVHIEGIDVAAFFYIDEEAEAPIFVPERIVDAAYPLRADVADVGECIGGSHRVTQGILDLTVEIRIVA